MVMVYYSNPIRTLVMVRKYEEGGLAIDAGLFFFASLFGDKRVARCFLLKIGKKIERHRNAVLQNGKPFINYALMIRQLLTVCQEKFCNRFKIEAVIRSLLQF